MMFRLACVLVIASQLVLLNLYLRPSGHSAIAFSFLGNPLVAVGVLLAIVWVLRVYRRIRSAKLDRDVRNRAAARSSG
jgi:hypothetical protein